MLHRPALFLPLALLAGGCFDPDYGDGGFTCKWNTCPEGYQCVESDAGKHCRRTGSVDGRARDGGAADQPTIFDCTGKPDGTDCSLVGGKGFLCLKGKCVASSCGDLFVDQVSGEECEDGNQDPADGCNGCKWTCKENPDCDDKLVCNGSETCDPQKHTCSAGTNAADGASCVLPDSKQGVCNGGVCSTAGCGNKVLETGEECDDGNKTDGDGCDNTCKYSCHQDSDCDDSDLCNGVEVCKANPVGKACQLSSPALTCNDNLSCTDDSCDPVKGCVYTPIDSDKDGKSCGEDCNDSDPAIYKGAPECADGKDNDCDGATDEAPLADQKCWSDPDADTYASASATPLLACGCPPKYTNRDPTVSGQADCAPSVADAHPGQTKYFGSPYCKFLVCLPPPCSCASNSYDYNCDGAETRADPYLAASSCTISFLSCKGSGWTGTVVPACGVTASFKTCSYDLKGQKCNASIAQRKQTCR